MDGGSCSKAILDVVPDVMQFIRAEMRQGRPKELSVPQFRALVFLSKHEGASLSMVAEHLGLSPAGASAIVDCLAERRLVLRAESPGDRRMIALSLTAEGRKGLARSREAALRRIDAILSSVDPEGRRTVLSAMSILREAFDGRA